MLYSVRIAEMRNPNKFYYIHRYDNENTQKIINARLHMELNTAGTFGFTILENNKFYKLIESPLKHLVDIVYEGEDGTDQILWRGRTTRINVDFYSQKTVECEGCMSFLADTIVPTARFNGITVKGLLQYIVNMHNSYVFSENVKKFELGTVEEAFANRNVYGVSVYNTSLEMISDLCVRKHGGYITVTPKEDGFIRLDYTKDPIGTNLSQKMEFGINIMDITTELDMKESYTAVIPLGKSGLNTEKKEDVTAPGDIETEGGASDGDTIIERAIKLAVAIANDDRYGYSRTYRSGPYTYDCASFMFYVWQWAGAKTMTYPNNIYAYQGPGYTASIKPIFCSSGIGFEDIRSRVNPDASEAGLLPGDILVRNYPQAGGVPGVGDHVAMYIGNGKVVEAKMEGVGIVVWPYYANGWNEVLRYKDRTTLAPQLPSDAPDVISEPVAHDESTEEEDKKALEDAKIDDRLTIESVNGGRPFITLETNQDEMPENGWIYKVVTNDDIEDPQELLEWGRNELEEMLQTNTVLTISAVDLSGKSSEDKKVFGLGDRVYVRSPKHGQAAEKRLPISIIDINILDPRDGTYTLGFPDNPKISGVYK